MPVNQISGLARGEDGYLWLATFDGLVRFDGHRFGVLSTSNRPDLPSNRLRDLLATPDGSLWMLTETGEVVRYFRGAFTTYQGRDGLPEPVFELRRVGETVFALGSGGLSRLVPGPRFERVRPDVLRGEVRSVFRDEGGAIWASACTGRGPAASGSHTLDRRRCGPCCAPPR